MEINLVGERRQSGKARRGRGESAARLQGSRGQVWDVLALSLIRSQRGPEKLITASLVHRCKKVPSQLLH